MMDNAEIAARSGIWRPQRPDNGAPRPVVRTPRGSIVGRLDPCGTGHPSDAEWMRCAGDPILT